MDGDNADLVGLPYLRSIRDLESNVLDDRSLRAFDYFMALEVENEVTTEVS